MSYVYNNLVTYNLSIKFIPLLSLYLFFLMSWCCCYCTYIFMFATLNLYWNIAGYKITAIKQLIGSKNLKSIFFMPGLC